MALSRYYMKMLCGAVSHRPMLMRLVSRSDCEKVELPVCSPANIARSPCAQKKKAEKAKTEADKDKKCAKGENKSMWENPECCLDPCPDMHPRFDALYYKPSDKAKRLYFQTWVECPEIKIKPKKICCFDQIRLPPIQKRVLKKMEPTGQCPPASCKKKTNSRCPRVNMPGCGPGRKPPHCKPTRAALDCKKICTPYPSFSECTSPKPKPLPPQECKCLNLVSMCEVWAYYRKRQLSKK